MNVRSRSCPILLHLEPALLAERIAHRTAHPDRSEHAVNNSLIAPGDASELLSSLESIPELRPRTKVIDASGTLEEVTDRIVRAIGS